jgi:hypothetical protein
MADKNIVTVGAPLPRLASAVILDRKRVRITWRDGNSVTVDLEPVFMSHRHFIPLRNDDELFQTLRVNEDGTALEWDEGMELSAVWIGRLPTVGMANSEFRGIMEELGMSLDGMASQLEVSRRLIAAYRGTKPIPNTVAFAARYLLISSKRSKDAVNPAASPPVTR